MEDHIDQDGTLFDQPVIWTYLLEFFFNFLAEIVAPKLVVFEVYVVYQDIIEIHLVLVIPFCKLKLLFTQLFLLFCHFL
jgi:hypothetical protein